VGRLVEAEIGGGGATDGIAGEIALIELACGLDKKSTLPI